MREFDLESTALGFVAGHTGVCLEAMVKEMNISTEFVHLSEGITRVNVKARSFENADSVTETDINCTGPDVKTSELNELKQKLANVTNEDMVVISGSVSPSIQPQDFAQIVAVAADKGAKVVVDTTGDYLRASLKSKPFLVKPNEEELYDFFGANNEVSIEELALKMQELGAENVLVSLGAEGAILCKKSGEIIKTKAPKGLVVNTVGAGDSMVAGFVAAISEDRELETALEWGICAGSATAFCEGLASREDIKRLLDSFISEKE